MYCSYPSPGEQNKENRVQFQRATAKGHQCVIQLVSERVVEEYGVGEKETSQPRNELNSQIPGRLSPTSINTRLGAYSSALCSAVYP